MNNEILRLSPEDQLFLARDERVGELEKVFLEKFAQYPPEAPLMYTSTIPNTPRWYFSKQIGTELFARTKLSLHLSALEAGYDFGYQSDYTALIKGESPPFVIPKEIDICPEGHIMNPRFKANGQDVLYYRCLSCQTNRFVEREEE